MIHRTEKRDSLMKFVQGTGNSRKVWPLVDKNERTTWNNSPRSDRGFQSGTRSIIDSQTLRQNIIESYHDPESFHRAIGRTLAVAQVFGGLPVYGVLDPSPKSLEFRKYSLRTTYTILLITMLAVVSVGSIIHMINFLKSREFGISGGIGAATVGAVFYGNSLMSLVIFLWLAPRWPSVQNEWRAMEQLIDSSKLGRPKLRLKFSIITGVILLCALAEHVVSMVNNTPKYRRNENATIDDFLEEYARSSHDFIIDIWGYNSVMGVYLFVVGKVATFMWNFTDLFVILISTGLADRYKVLNQRVLSNKTTSLGNKDWKALRECYASLSALVKSVDGHISPIVLLSFANNLYFVCLQLLNGISEGQTSGWRDQSRLSVMRWCIWPPPAWSGKRNAHFSIKSAEPEADELINVIYFFGSMAFLIFRTIGVTLMAARINDHSQVALPMLYTCSSASYCIETQRLENQLATDQIALTGLKFFAITRNFLLAVTGAILTYEVVLLQFNLAVNTE